MNKAMFVPAIGEQFNHTWNRGLKYKNYDMKFFTEQSHFELDIALQSCYYGINGVGKNKDVSFREMIKFPKDKTLITDSAGFQIASFKKRGEVCNIEPIDSLRWQEENGDVCMNLDIPPTLDKIPSYEEFNVALNQSIKNFQLFETKRQNYNMKLLNVLHGETLKLQEIWYDKVKHFNFDGFAVGMKPPWDSMIQAMGFLYLWEKGEFDKNSFKWLHFFGTSGKHVVPTLVYAASKLNKINVSYDSSSYNIGSIYRTYYLPFDIGPHLSFGEKFKLKNPHLKSLPCQCPVCNSIGDISELNTTDIYAGTLISLHNLYQYEYYNNILNKLVGDRELYIEYLKKINISDKTLLSLDFIDYGIENGITKAVQKYEKYLIPQDLNKTKQVNIFNF